MAYLLSDQGKEVYGDIWNQIDIPYGWGRPQNPVGHKGSMQFSENGRLALLNPCALMILFGRHQGSLDDNSSYFTRGRLDSIKLAYQTETPIESILETAFALAQVISITIKPELSSEEYVAIPGIILKERRLLQCFFHAVGKDTRAEVPNIHVSRHYIQDIK